MVVLLLRPPCAVVGGGEEENDANDTDVLPIPPVKFGRRGFGKTANGGDRGAFGSASDSVRSVSANTRAMRRERREEARVRRWKILRADTLDDERFPNVFFAQ